MRFRASTLERVSAAYADAIAAGDYEAAEGWFAVARMVAERDRERGISRVSGRRSATLGRPALR